MRTLAPTYLSRTPGYVPWASSSVSFLNSNISDGCLRAILFAFLVNLLGKITCKLIVIQAEFDQFQCVFGRQRLAVFRILKTDANIFQKFSLGLCDGGRRLRRSCLWLRIGRRRRRARSLVTISNRCALQILATLFHWCRHWWLSPKGKCRLDESDSSFGFKQKQSLD